MREFLIGAVAAILVFAAANAGHARHLQGMGCDAFASQAEIPTSQADRFEAFADLLDSSRTQSPRIYFVGIAFYSDAVFENDIDLVGCRIRSRFGDNVLSAMLSNSARDQYLLPKTAMIRRVTKEIASVSNQEADLVIVYISSHGSRNTIATKRGQTTGFIWDSDLARMFKSLRGLRTVFFVQACYSGSLIDKLEDRRRIIITAAAANRQSFGCGTQDRFTYFGSALAEVLSSGSSSLKEIYSALLILIGNKEDVLRQRIDPPPERSDPQIWIGKDMAAFATSYFGTGE